MRIIHRMHVFAVAVAVMIGSSAACAVVASVTLEPEKDLTVHLGDVAALRVPSSRQFSIGSAGSALLFVNKKQAGDDTVYFYRAVAIGRQTFVATPRNPGPDGCVSCVTVHYFANVIQ
jgi:hypothetical protein